MTNLLNEPPIEWLNSVGRRIFDEWDYAQEMALIQAQRIWKEPRFAQMTGGEAVENWLHDWQVARDRSSGLKNLSKRGRMRTTANGQGYAPANVTLKALTMSRMTYGSSIKIQTQKS